MEHQAARVLHPAEGWDSPATGPDGRGHLAAVERPCSVLFDLPVELAEPAEMLRTITGWVGKGQQHRVMYVNAHVVNQSRALPELAGALTIDVEGGAQTAVLGFRRDVAEQGIAAQFGDQIVGPQPDQRGIGAGQRVLILRAAGLG